MAKGLGLETVAEGIESEQVLSYITELECDYGQGFYWSEAIPSDAFICLLNDGPKE